MKSRRITATELARNLSAVLDRLEKRDEEVVILRHNRPIGRLIAEPTEGNALEVFGDLYRTLSDEEAVRWEADARRAGLREQRLPAKPRDLWRC